MRNLLFLFLTAALVVVSACTREGADNMILVEGGTFVNTKSSYFGREVTVQSFYIGKYEVTQKEWMDVMENNPLQFKGDNLPVEMVSWYDAIEYCNKRSLKEGLKPYYNIDKDTPDPKITDELDDTKWTVTVNADAGGYRLPTEVEWDYAAGGGRKSKSYTYSGGDEPYQGRILRGGGWVSGEYCSASGRDASNANRMSPDLGFRVCRSRYPDDSQNSN